MTHLPRPGARPGEHQQPNPQHANPQHANPQLGFWQRPAQTTAHPSRPLGATPGEFSAGPSADDPHGPWHHVSSPSDTVVAVERPPVRRLRPWIFGVISLLIAVVLATAWGVFVQLRITDHGEPWPASEPWTDTEQGLTFQVLKVTEVAEVRYSENSLAKAPEGAVIQLWEIKVTGVLVARKRTGDSVLCSFNLLGENDAMWMTNVSNMSENAAATCSNEQFDATGEGVLTMSYTVPTSRLDQVLGIQLDHPMGVDQPPVLQAP